MYSWSEDTSDWYGSGSYRYSGAGGEERAAAAAAEAVAGSRTYAHKSAPNPSMIDPHKKITTNSAHPIIVAVDVTGSMANWPFEIFDRLPLLYNTLSQYKEDVEICFAAIGDAGVDRWPLQVTEFAHGYDLEQQLNALYGEGGGGDAPESYGLFAWWVENHVTTPAANYPFLIVFGDAPMHAKIPASRWRTSWATSRSPRGSSIASSAAPRARASTPSNAGTGWRRAGTPGSCAAPRAARATRWTSSGPRPWAHEKVFHIDDEQRAVDYAMGLVARSWGRFEDFQTNLRARQDEGKVKAVADKLRKEGPRVLQCPSCGARIPAEAVGRYVCAFCHSTLEL